jgi:hypothetical protein
MSHIVTVYPLLTKKLQQDEGIRDPLLVVGLAVNDLCEAIIVTGEHGYNTGDNHILNRALSEAGTICPLAAPCFHS